MKIGIVCYPTFGGSGVLATELGKALARDLGHEVHFISYSQPVRLDDMSSSIYYHEVGMMSYPLFEHPPYESALISKLVDVVKHTELDLLHVHYAIPHAFSAYVARQILRDEGISIPIVTTLHGTDITLVGKDSSYKPVVEFSINHSDAVTAVSEFLKEETLRSFRINNEINVIPNFVDLQRFQRTNVAHFKRMFAPDGECVLVHTSNFRKVKRIDDVIRVFHLVRQQLPARLLMLGDGPERSNAEYMVRELGIADDVRFLGKVDAVEQVLSMADVFLLPSQRESFGLAALEAMACGVPVVSSDAEGLPEVNIHGETGYLAPVADVQSMAKHCLSILEDAEKLEAFRHNARERAQSFSLGAIMMQYEELYKRVLAQELVV